MDYLLVEQEEDFRKEKELAVIEEATTLVLAGLTRQEAIAQAREHESERAQAICDREFVEDECGHPENFINLPSQDGIDHSNPQHVAIYNDFI